MLRIFRFDEEDLLAEEGSPLEFERYISGLREKDCNASLSNEVNISLNFALIFLEDISMMSLRKEEVIRSSAKIVSLV